MSKQRNKRYKNRGGEGYAALVILFVILLAVGAYLIFHKKEHKPSAPATVEKFAIPTVPKEPLPQQLPPQQEKPITGNAPKHQKTEPDSDAGVPTTGNARLAIIIDDMGTSMQEARSLASIGVPITFSIIPKLHSYREVASFAVSNGIEVMIHMPMQPKEWPQRKIEANGLLLSMEDSAVTERLAEYMREIPKAVGANNHMGSSFTEDEQKMRVVLLALKGQDKFFIDSITSPHTVGLRLAREMGLKSARRDVFLDNEQNREYIKGQLNQAVRLARKTGASIAICHPHPATIKTLQELLPTLKGQGITLVSASQLVR